MTDPYEDHIDSRLTVMVGLAKALTELTTQTQLDSRPHNYEAADAVLTVLSDHIRALDKQLETYELVKKGPYGQ